ncbi:MAG: hypothetical protein IJY84_06075 [Clostridia bacterium]|nr:hypothetical protein [Clostridia bacterium]
MKKVIAIMLCFFTVFFISCKKPIEEVSEESYYCATCKDKRTVDCCFVCKCHSCKGSGTEKVVCYNCDGRGYTTISDCSECTNGYYYGFKCDKCKGVGYIKNDCRCDGGLMDIGSCKECGGDGILYNENKEKCQICNWTFFSDGWSAKRCPDCNK